MKLKRSLIILSAATLEGIAAILILVLKFASTNSLTESEWAASKGIWIGLVGLIVILLVIVSLWFITFKAFRDRSWVAAAYQRLAYHLNQNHSLLILAETLVFLLLLGGVFLFLLWSPAAFERSIYQTLFTEGRWITGYEHLRDLIIGGWYWAIQRQPIHGSWLLFPVLLLLALALFYFVLKKSKSIWLNLLLLVTLGYVLQVGFGFINGQGYEYTRLKYAGTLHQSYAVTASNDNLDPIQNIRNYVQ